MQGREPSMEEILASIKKVIAEEKDIKTPERRGDPAPSAPSPVEQGGEEEVLELDQPIGAPEADLGPPLVDEPLVDAGRSSFDQLRSVAASAPPQPSVNPLEEMVRDMLRPILKQWLDDHLPQIIDEHVKREIARITGKPL